MRSGKSEYKNGLRALLIGMTINPTGKYESVGMATPGKNVKVANTKENFSQDKHENLRAEGMP